MTNIPPSPMAQNGIIKGDVFSFEYPFINLKDMGDWNWKPGIRYDIVSNNMADGEDYDSVAVADGIGKQVLTVIDIHKPGKYPSRIFFTRTWVTPIGEKFGKTKLRILSAGSFKTLLKGFRYPYKLLIKPPSPVKESVT